MGKALRENPPTYPQSRQSALSHSFSPYSLYSGGIWERVQGLEGPWVSPHDFSVSPSIQASSHLEAASGSRPCPRKGRGLKRSSPAPGSHRYGQGLAASQLPCWSRWSG